jgi:hypothetical protein
LTCILHSTPPRRRAARLTAELALSAVLALGTFVASAGAQPHRDDQHRGDRGFVRHDDRGYRGDGYYPAPPVVYGGPVYAPPPVVYGPSVGIYLPGVSIGIQ